MPLDEVRRVARFASKGSAHMRLDEGPLLAKALDVRLSPRHDFSDFKFILSCPGYGVATRQPGRSRNACEDETKTCKEETRREEGGREHSRLDSTCKEESRR